MATTLPISPADIVRQLLIDMGLGANGGTVWPVSSTKVPDDPDEVIIVTDTTGKQNGRAMYDGKVFRHIGIQIMVRAGLHVVGYAKADAIWTDIATVLRHVVTLDGVGYFIQCFANISNVIPLGMEREATARNLFTINALAAIKPVT